MAIDGAKPASFGALDAVAIVQDRYGGTYSGGLWVAIRDAGYAEAGLPRVAWALNNGPNGSDLEAAAFWREAPDWIASADSPGAAVDRLIKKAKANLPLLD